jgi:hypothetical protein
MFERALGDGSNGRMIACLSSQEVSAHSLRNVSKRGGEYYDTDLTNVLMAALKFIARTKNTEG